MSRKIVLCIVLVAAIVLCSAGSVAAAAPAREVPSEGNQVSAFPPVDVPDPVVRWMVDQVDQETVRAYAGALSGEWPVTIRGRSYQIRSRHTASDEPIRQATYFVGDHLVSLGLSVEYQQWAPGSPPNVIGQKTGLASPGDIFMVSAHLDDLPTSELAPGADDNASGSTAVLVAADVLSELDWDCTLRFAFWTGEEQGLLGSAHYATEARDNDENILGVFNFDMIGWNTPGSSPDADLVASTSLPATVELANQAAGVIGAYGLELIPQVIVDVEGLSDHESFWAQDYAAILGIEDYYPNGADFSPYYHEVTDRLSTLDLGYFTEYVKLAVAETAHMADCLSTGTLQGQVNASHDGQPVAGAAIELQDAIERAFRLYADADGQYVQAVPPGSYDATVSAYGYDDAAASDVGVDAGETITQDFTLVAAAPVAPGVVIGLDAGEANLTWHHISPNVAYRVHRSSEPYFAPGEETMIATVEAAHPPAVDEVLGWPDGESGSGDAEVNHFYVVLGMNPVGAGAPSSRTGEFDFHLVR